MSKYIMSAKILAIFLFGAVIFSENTQAQEVPNFADPVTRAMNVLTAPQANQTEDAAEENISLSAPQDSLIVTDVLIDKTSENAVKARTEAITEARRIAFQMLVERNMTAEAAAAFQYPNDKNIAGLVQDFEIHNEQLSSTRYVANFTVRFSEAVRRFVPVPVPVARYNVTHLATGSAAPVQTLILPYYEHFSGKTFLWEEPNPWRAAWQTAETNGITLPTHFIVPLGDLTDVAAGKGEALWMSDYTVVEKVMQNYRADAALILVAGKSGAVIKVDVYRYQNGALVRKGQVVPKIDEDMFEDQAFATAVAEVVRFLEREGDIPNDASAVGLGEGADVSAPTETQVYSAESPADYVVSENKTVVDAGMEFDSFMTWMETQKRLASIHPRVNVGIRNISKNGAQFTLRFNGDMDMFMRVLADQGLALSRGNAGYQLQLIHSN